MKTQKTLGLLMAALALGALPVQAQTSTQDLFQVKFNATCTPADNINRPSIKMTERDLIQNCVGTGFTARQLRTNFGLVYNSTADSIQVVNVLDGSLVCDVFLFQGGTNVASANRLSRLTFVFRPDQAEAIGSAVITEKPFKTDKNGRLVAGISGKIQFSMANSSNNTVVITSVITNVDGLNTNGITNSITGDTNSVPSSSDHFVQANAAAAATNTGVQICVGTFTAGRAFVVGQPTTGAGSTNIGGTNTVADIRFVNQALQSGMTEIQLGQLSAQNSTNQAVIDFGQLMVQDHTQMNSQLTQLAEQKGITVPTALDTAHQATVNRLTKLQGRAFDRAYRPQEVGSHRASIALYQAEAARSKDADFKAFAESNLPTLQQHLADALQLPQ